MADVKDLGNGWVLRRQVAGTTTPYWEYFICEGGRPISKMPHEQGEAFWSALEARDQQIARLAQEVDKRGLTDQQIAALQEVAEAAKRINWTPDDGSLTQALAKARALGALKEE